MSSMVNPAERDVPGNIIDLDLGFFHYLQSRTMTSLTSVPEQQRFPTAVQSSALNQISSETNHQSFNEGIPQLENKCPVQNLMLDVGSLGPGLCGILFQFTGLA